MVTADEWPEFCMEFTIAKAATPATNLFLNTGNMEEFKAFADADKDRQGLPPQRGGRQGLLPQHGDHEVLNLIKTNQYDISDDVSTQASADNDRQRLLQQRGGHLNGSHDVSPSPTTNAEVDIPRLEQGRGCVQGSLRAANGDGRVQGSLAVEVDVPSLGQGRVCKQGSLRTVEVDVSRLGQERGHTNGSPYPTVDWDNVARLSLTRGKDTILSMPITERFPVIACDPGPDYPPNSTYNPMGGTYIPPHYTNNYGV